MPSMPPGPWVLVVGAHRSGTSAVTGALAALGLQGVDDADRMEWEASNPEHWESLAAALYDDELLDGLGGSWDAPPPPGLQPDPAIGADRAADILATAYPGDAPPVWKDPRVCLLLPWWRDVLPAPLTAVFVWRDPRAVARSLEARDGMPYEYGLALWERYVRSAVAGLAGVDTYVVDYAALVDEPGAVLRPLATWLGSRPALAAWADAFDVAAAVDSVAADLRHQQADGAPLPEDTRVLADWLSGLSGAYAPFDASPPAVVSVWPEALVTTRRQRLDLERRLRDADAEVARLDDLLVRLRAESVELERQLREGFQTEIDRLVEEIHVARHQAREAEGDLRRIEGSTSWKVTAPLRSTAARVRRPSH